MRQLLYHKENVFPEYYVALLWIIIINKMNIELNEILIKCMKKKSAIWMAWWHNDKLLNL